MENKENKILPVPEIPLAIKDAVSEGKLAIFVGAGVSRIVGCKGWDDLASTLLNICHIQELINFKEKESLKTVRNNKELITITYELLKDNGKEEVFYYSGPLFLDTKKCYICVKETGAKNELSKTFPGI